MLILDQNDIFCGHHVVNFSVWFLQLTVFKYLVASHVTEPGSLLTEPGAVIKFSHFCSHPGTCMLWSYMNHLFAVTIEAATEQRAVLCPTVIRDPLNDALDQISGQVWWDTAPMTSNVSIVLTRVVAWYAFWQMLINTSRPEQNGCCFILNIFKYSQLNETYGLAILP